MESQHNKKEVICFNEELSALLENFDQINIEDEAKRRASFQFLHDFHQKMLMYCCVQLGFRTEVLRNEGVSTRWLKVRECISLDVNPDEIEDWDQLINQVSKTGTRIRHSDEYIPKISGLLSIRERSIPFSKWLITAVKDYINQSKIRSLVTVFKNLRDYTDGEQHPKLLYEIINTFSEDDLRYIEMITQKSETPKVLDASEIQQVQIFLNEINALLENEFTIVKERFFPKVWKIGILVNKSAEDDSLLYSLVPILWGSNLPSIIEVSDQILKETKLRSILSYHRFRNKADFLENPNKSALNRIKGYLNQIFEMKAFNIRGNRFLALEYIFSAVDKYWKQLGLEKKDSYTINEIEFGLTSYLPYWIQEALKVIPQKYKHRIWRGSSLHLDSFLIFVPQYYEEMIKKKVKDCLTKGPPTFELEFLDNKEIPLKLLFESFLFLKDQSQTDLTRVYRPPDYSRLKNLSNWIWDKYSPADLIANLRTFYENLIPCYNTILTNNFPKLQDKLPYFHGATKIVVEVALKERYDSPPGPTKRTLFLEGEKNTKRTEDLTIDVILESEEKIPNDVFITRTLSYEGTTYTVLAWEMGGLDFIFGDIPMLNSILKILLNSIDQYYGSDLIDQYYFDLI